MKKILIAVLLCTLLCGCKKEEIEVYNDYDVPEIEYEEKKEEVVEEKETDVLADTLWVEASGDIHIYFSDNGYARITEYIEYSDMLSERTVKYRISKGMIEFGEESYGFSLDGDSMELTEGDVIYDYKKIANDEW